MIAAATSGATIADSAPSSPFASVAKYRMIASETRPMMARMPMLPIIGAQVPSWSSAPSVLES